MTGTIRAPQRSAFSKPRFPVIRRDHPLAQKLSKCFLFQDLTGTGGAWKCRDLVSGSVATYTRNNADTGWRQSHSNRPGPFFVMGASGDAVSFLDSSPGVNFTTEVSVFGLLAPVASFPFLESMPVSANAACYAFSSHNSADSIDGFQVALLSTGAWAGIAGPGKVLGARYTGTTISAGEWHSVGGSYIKDGTATYGGQCTAFLDGVLVANNNYIGAGSFGGSFGANTAPHIMKHNGSLTSSKVPSLLYIWNRALSPADFAMLHVTPYMFFHDDVSMRGWVGAVAAPSGYKPYWSSQRPRVYGAGVR